MTTHLHDSKTPYYAPRALCGREGERTMSRHEIKRGRITCARCLEVYAEREAKYYDRAGY